MFRLSHFYFMLCYLLIISENNVVQSDCKGSYVVFCESIDELEDESSENKKSWKEVTVGNDSQIPHRTIKEYNLSLNGTKKWTIINQFKGFDVNIIVPSSVESLILYGNDFKNLSINILAGEVLEILSLHHNNIENIHLIPRQRDDYDGNAVWFHSVDLSFNKLKYTKSGKFFKNAVAEEMILSHNELWTIGTYCLPNALDHLRLDYNEFVYFSMINLNFQNFYRLEYLSVAHNKLQAVDDLPLLNTLKHLDLSFNNLFQISNVFGSFKKLRILNLEYNNLIRFSFPLLIGNKSDVYNVNLRFNRLRNLDLEPIRSCNIRLFLFGNPWNCECIEKMITEKSYVTDTALVVANCLPAHVPCCVINQFYGEPCSDEQISEDTFNFFRNTTGEVMSWYREKCPFL